MECIIKGDLVQAGPKSLVETTRKCNWTLDFRTRVNTKGLTLFLAAPPWCSIRPIRSGCYAIRGQGRCQNPLVATEIEGKSYTGFYTVRGGVITVESDWGEQTVGPQAERTARLLLLETLRRAKVLRRTR